VLQLDLFSPQPLALRSLQLAIEGLDVDRSALQLAEYRNMWADEGLTFEPGVLSFFADRLPQHDPDDAILTWKEFSATPVFGSLDGWQECRRACSAVSSKPYPATMACGLQAAPRV